MFGTRGAEELCESLSCKWGTALFSKGESLRREKPSRQRKKVKAEKETHSTYQVFRTAREWFSSLHTYAYLFSPVFNLPPILLVSLWISLPPNSTVLSLHVTQTFFSLCFSSSFPVPALVRGSKRREKQGKQLYHFFFHLVTKRTARTRTTSTTTIETDVLQHGSFASLEKTVSGGCRGLSTSLRGGIEAFEDRRQPVSRLCPRAHWPAGHWWPYRTLPPGSCCLQQTCLEGHRASPRGTSEAATLPGSPEARLPPHGGHPAVANSCVSASAAPRPRAGSAPPPSPPLRGEGGGGTESARPGGF